MEQGEYVAIMGESGSGKTTLLNLLAGLDKPTGGRIFLGDTELSAIKDRQLAAWRRENLGFVFQDFNLLDTFSLKDNIFAPGAQRPRLQRDEHPAAAPGRKAGDHGLLEKYPYEVSGGQKQRAAVAQALITEPQLVLADEPTGALDSRSSDELLDLFGQVNKAGQTILMVTHSAKAASHAGRVLFIRTGGCSTSSTGAGAGQRVLWPHQRGADPDCAGGIAHA